MSVAFFFTRRRHFSQGNAQKQRTETPPKMMKRRRSSSEYVLAEQLQAKRHAREADHAAEPIPHAQDAVVQLSHCLGFHDCSSLRVFYDFDDPVAWGTARELDAVRASQRPKPGGFTAQLTPCSLAQALVSREPILVMGRDCVVVLFSARDFTAVQCAQFDPHMGDDHGHKISLALPWLQEPIFARQPPHDAERAFLVVASVSPHRQSPLCVTLYSQGQFVSSRTAHTLALAGASGHLVLSSYKDFVALPLVDGSTRHGMHATATAAGETKTHSPAEDTKSSGFPGQTTFRSQPLHAAHTFAASHRFHNGHDETDCAFRQQGDCRDLAHYEALDAPTTPWKPSPPVKSPPVASPPAELPSMESPPQVEREMLERKQPPVIQTAGQPREKKALAQQRQAVVIEWPSSHRDVVAHQWDQEERKVAMDIDRGPLHAAKMNADARMDRRIMPALHSSQRAAPAAPGTQQTYPQAARVEIPPSSPRAAPMLTTRTPTMPAAAHASFPAEPRTEEVPRMPMVARRIPSTRENRPIAKLSMQLEATYNNINAVRGHTPLCSGLLIYRLSGRSTTPPRPRRNRN